MVITGVARIRQIHLLEFRVELLHVIVNDTGVMVFAEHHLLACLEIKTANFNFFNRAAGILGSFERPVEQFCCITIWQGTPEQTDNLFSHKTVDAKNHDIVLDTVLHLVYYVEITANLGALTQLIYIFDVHESFGE